MNKHVKCVLKLIGAPFVLLSTFLGVASVLPAVCLFVLVDVAGCTKKRGLYEDPFPVKMMDWFVMDYPKWYKNL